MLLSTLETQVGAEYCLTRLTLKYLCLDGVWDKTGFECLTVGTAAAPVRKMVVIGGNIWCATANTIKILNPNTGDIVDTVRVGVEESKAIIGIVESGLGVWVAQQSSAVVSLLHSQTLVTLCEVSTTATVAKMLANCDEIIRQHKTACLRVTALLAVKVRSPVLCVSHQ